MGYIELDFVHDNLALRLGEFHVLDAHILAVDEADEIGADMQEEEHESGNVVEVVFVDEKVADPHCQQTYLHDHEDLQMHLK